jgi:serine phosphatase RsbU (regulator of sigma subunit)/anti-sigma regulatory factor (Ser/Thr protein kinase)
MSAALPPSPTSPTGPRIAEGRLWQWSGPATLLAIRSAGLTARAWLANAGAPEDELAAWELLFAEGANNVAVHGGGEDSPQLLEIDLRILPDRIIANIIDQTEGFDWPDTVSLPDDNSESGRGLFILEALTTARAYHRSRGRNTLTLERETALPYALSPAPANDPVLEETLDSMTEELSACYESLSAIFRFTAEARQTTTLTDFADRLLRHLATITGADYGMLRVVNGPDLTTLANHSCHGPASCPVGQSPYPMEAAAVSSRQDQWIEPSSAPDQPQAGLVHPFYHEDELMGLLTVGRRHSTEPLNAGQVNIIHTFSEFFAQQVLSRRHAEAAIAASVAHREIELAAEIQRSLLPSQFPDIPGITLAGHCESALTVGGDFYDVIPWTSHGFFFIVADVMGKGVGASMMAAVTRSVFRSLNQLYQTPARAMERAARLLFGDLDRLEMFVTAAVGVVDLHQGVVRLANAGHCPVLVALPDGTVVSAEPSIAPLGLEKSPLCSETTVPFPPGARLLIYSDGLVDPRDLRSPFPSPDEAGAWLALAAQGRPTAEALKAALLARIGCIPSQGPTAAQADDQTFLVIACDAPTPPI